MIKAPDENLNSLKKKIQEAKEKIEEPVVEAPKPLGKIMKVVVEIVAAMAVGLGIGILIDNYFDTRPFFIIVFFLLGSAAGIMNVFRVAKSLQNH
jgi:ATP synthase protein I|tara:strand:- start:2297 stop:2581 length:285 start_codon:yes stop_codon:yes gene_type:complete